jgi:Trk-type K+ transport system membrane component
MLSNSFTAFHLIFFVFLVALSIMFLHQAWENIVNKRVSKYSLDALVVHLSNQFANATNRARTQQLSKDPKRLFILGFFVLLASIKGVMEAYSWMIKYLLK